MMTNSAGYPSARNLFLRLGLGLVDLFDVLGGVFLEVFEAIFAAKLDFASVVGEDVRLAHFAKLLA